MRRNVCSLFLLFLVSLILATGVAEEESMPEWLFSIRINPYGGEAEDADAIAFVNGTESGCLFLPADTDEEQIRIWYDDSFSLLVDGKETAKGAFCPELVSGEHVFTKVAEDTELLTVCVYRSANIPAVYIHTQSGSMDYIHETKGNKEPGIIRVHEEGQITLDGELQSIAGRGNATWKYEKKPYNIKLKDSTGLLGMSESKKWCLLANYKDPTFLKNSVGWYLADELGLQYTSESRHADLYINGIYMGNYVICEKVEVDENRVEIRDLGKENAALNGDPAAYPQWGTGDGGTVLPGSEKGSLKWIAMPDSPEDITGGYLLEYDREDRYNEELCGFVTDNGQCVVIKSPEYASRKETEYISALVNEATAAIYTPSGTNGLGKHYTDYFDLDSLASMYIIREFGNDIDAGFSSAYLIKRENNDLLYSSPIWDMDRAWGDHLERFGVDYGDPDIWWANSLYDWIGTNRQATVFNAAYRHEDFRKAVQKTWDYLIEDGILENLLTMIHTNAENLRASALMDAVRWNSFGMADSNTVLNRYADACRGLTRFIEKRKKSLSRGFSDDAVMLYYDANGGDGGVFNASILTKGDEAVVIGIHQEETEIKAPDSSVVFKGWNTSANGSGRSYLPGDLITVDEETILYAQWGVPFQVHCQAVDISESGDVILDVMPQTLKDAGINAGDTILIISGEQQISAPFYTGRYASESEMMLIPSEDGSRILLTMNQGNCSEAFGLTSGNEIGIELKETGGAWALQKINNLVIMDRELYDTDEAYGNFRCVTTGNITYGKLFRSASPIYTNEKGFTLNRLLEENGIQTVMNMAYNENEVPDILSQYGTEMTYYGYLFENGAVYARKLPYWFEDEGFSSELISGFTFLADHEPPYLLHCHGGRDRTGFSAMILEMLTGASREEIIRDYMMTYQNFYGIRVGTEAYRLIRDRNIGRMLKRLAAGYGSEDDLALLARNYLLTNGMDPEKLNLLVSKLTGP